MARDINHQVHSISSLPPSRAEDRDRRTRSYLIAMSIRTACFLLVGVFVTVLPWPPGAWICIAGAVLLPYPAVVYANRQDRRTVVSHHDPVVHRMITAPAGTHDWAQHAPGPTGDR